MLVVSRQAGNSHPPIERQPTRPEHLQAMIEALKDDDLVRRVGGKFRLTSLIQKRWAQLMDGARPLVERRGRSDLEVVVEEIRLERITFESIEHVAPGDTEVTPPAATL
jgi:DNA-directed RNA polymerase subunit omega